MIDKLKREECCGCNACGDVCPKAAISFKSDEEGFLNPIIDHSLCVDCGLCDKVCPSINSNKLKTNDFEKPICYAAVHKNLDVRFDSTSGGAFSAFAKKAYLEKYYVGGAVWNEDWSVSQYISNDKKDLERLRSSKYIQSDARGIYKRVGQLLKAGEKVLICGTPCQIAGLKSFLGKEYENLITLDFVCMYVNSPLVWKKYIDFLENEHKSKVIYIKDKNKEIGWRTLCNKVVFDNGDVIYDTHDVNHFRRCYMRLGVASRPSCHQCHYKGFPRVSDISLADFWGVEKYLPKDFDNDLGTSLILCNSQKGADFFDDKVRKYLNVTSIELDDALLKNPALITAYNPSVPFSRTKFYDDLKTSNIKDVVDDYYNRYKYNSSSFKSKIKNVLKFWRDVLFCSGFHVGTFCKNLYYNFFSKHIKNSILNGKYIVLYPHCVLELKEGAIIQLDGVLRLGHNFYKKEKKFTKLLMRKDSLFDIKGNYLFSAGCDIQIFNNAKFTIEGGGDSNMNVEIVCGDSLTFQKYVYIGRNVIIRDTNGDHYISRQGYKTSKPVIIGTHAWICDRATVMPGVHVMPGGIVGACSYVVTDVPSFSMVSGNPARVVDEQVYWKA